MVKSMLLILITLAICATASNSEPAGGIQQITGQIDMCAKALPPSSCPVACFRADPVCGEDGVTYWCGCLDAKCNGARVSKLGACEVGNGGSASLPGQALLLLHIVWLILLGFSLLFGLF